VVQRENELEEKETLPEPQRAPKTRRDLQQQFAPGTMIRHYELIRHLGKGGMGDVHLARDTRLGRLVALKFLRSVSAEAAFRFATEAQATAQLDHENIVALHDIGKYEGMPYMVLEHVKGRTLSQWLEARANAVSSGALARVPPVRAAELMIPVVRALIRAHEAGLVHRDLKPSNIMLGDNGNVKVLDFGIAKLLRDAAQPKEVQAPIAAVEVRRLELLREAPETEEGVILGTRAYMAPEQWYGDKVDTRADIWAVGIMLYRIVAGKHPLEAITRENLGLAVGKMDVPMPSIREDVPTIGKLGAIIDRCLIKAKEDRLGTARELLAELESVARPRGAGSSHAEEVNPYTGLSAFQEQDAARFFGREGLVEQVQGRLTDLPLVAIVGSSGAGKSSLVRAGVIPGLKRGGEAWESFIMRPGPRPLMALATLVMDQAHPSSSDAETAPRGTIVEPNISRDGLHELFKREPGRFGAELRARARRRRERVLFFIDQFEESFTLADEDERKAFLACLRGAADDASSPLRLILSIRHDFLDRVAATDIALAELISRGTVLIGPMDREALKRALVAPALAVEYNFESEALLADMLDTLSHTAGALPLLQFTAAKLWEGRDRDKRLLTEASYRDLGGVVGALASHADHIVASMSETEKRWARGIFLLLVTPERTRAVVSRREISAMGGDASRTDLDRVLARLIDARLLLVEGANSDESTVELVHESLIQRWPLLGRWLDEAQDDSKLRARLRHAAKEWQTSKRPEGLLWRGEAAEEALRWHGRKGSDSSALLSAVEREYLLAVVNLSARSLRRRRQIVTVVMGGLAVVALCFSYLWLRAERETTRAEEHAARERAQGEETARQAVQARNAVRLSTAREVRDDPTLALALLREIEPGSIPRGWGEFSRRMLDSVVSAAVLQARGPVTEAIWSPDGQRIWLSSRDGLLEWGARGLQPFRVLHKSVEPIIQAAWTADCQRVALVVPGRVLVHTRKGDAFGPPVVFDEPGRVLHVQWSPDATRIALALADGSVHVQAAGGTAVPAVLRGHTDAVNRVAWSPDGRHIASASSDETVHVWAADGSGQPRIFKGHEAGVTGVVWSPDGNRLLSSSNDKTARLWSVNGKADPIVLRHDNPVGAVSFSADGQRIATATGTFDRVFVWGADGSGPYFVLSGHNKFIFSVQWSPDGNRIATTANDDTVRVWDIGASTRALVLRGHASAVATVAFSPDGHRLASGGEDATVRVWTLDGSQHSVVLRGHNDAVTSVAWTPDGLRVASSSMDGTVRIWSPDGAGKPLVLQRGQHIEEFAWSPDGRQLAVAHLEGFTIYDAGDGHERLTVLGHEGPVSAIAWTRDGRRIATAGRDGTLRVSNADGSGKPVVHDHRSPRPSIAWAPDGQRLAFSARNGAQIWNVDVGDEPIHFNGQDNLLNLSPQSFSGDGRKFVTASDDNTIRLWNADGTGEPMVFLNPGAPFVKAAVSADGQRVAGASADKNVWVWSDFSPVLDPDDRRLWNASTYCPSVELREKLLGLPEKIARADLSRCERMVQRLR
jgi:WD40 repeat protein/serine/threonine protein kinase